jgi:hypothetical protein
MVPLLTEFPLSPADARFIGNPVDFVVFDWFTQEKNDKGKNGACSTCLRLTNPQNVDKNP